MCVGSVVVELAHTSELIVIVYMCCLCCCWACSHPQSQLCYLCYRRCCCQACSHLSIYCDFCMCVTLLLLSLLTPQCHLCIRITLSGCVDLRVTLQRGVGTWEYRNLAWLCRPPRHTAGRYRERTSLAWLCRPPRHTAGRCRERTNLAWLCRPPRHTAGRCRWRTNLAWLCRPSCHTAGRCRQRCNIVWLCRS